MKILFVIKNFILQFIPIGKNIRFKVKILSSGEKITVFMLPTGNITY